MKSLFKYILTVIALGICLLKADYITYKISYAIDYELGIADKCNGSEEAKEMGCKFDYTKP